MQDWNWTVTGVTLGGCVASALAGLGIGWAATQRPGPVVTLLIAWLSVVLYVCALVAALLATSHELRERARGKSSAELARARSERPAMQQVGIALGIVAVCALPFVVFCGGLLGDPTDLADWAITTAMSYVALVPPASFALSHHQARLVRDRIDQG
ncbi:MAG: hypothetical protein Q4D79_06695 [Propionibacteriaceae bacterium]|nr:hypothetical protein [Propionibacteriaceae bacterium]